MDRPVRPRQQDEGAKDSVVLAYCECMVDKMPESETRSVTQWEKSHETERKACDKVAGWNSYGHPASNPRKAATKASG
jgi:hypothetical protein